MNASEKDDVTTQKWQLVRQDDNGNRHVLGIFPTKSEALEIMAHYERQGHKQTFWVEKADDSGR